ncbi:MAG TPA: hypothetical protein VMV18_12060 [bacterium]|nr:hypothetical protein [bacterium]
MALATVLLALKIAVVPVGADAATAGSLERTVEIRLHTGEFDLLEPSDVAAAMAAPPAPKPVFADEQKLLEEATAAYYDNREAFALERLTALQSLIDRRLDLPAAFRLRTRLWRATTFLSLNDPQSAEGEALAALAIDPDLIVDETEFRPTLADLVGRARKKLTFVTLSVTGLPAGAKLAVDGRAASPDAFKVPRGSHIVVVTAPGYRETARVVNASADVTLALPPPVAVPRDLDDSLSRLVFGGPSASDPTTIPRLLEKLHADAVVVVAVRGAPVADGARALVARSNGQTRASGVEATSPEGIVRIAAWAEGALRAPAVGVAPRPTPTPRGSTPSESAPVAFGARGALEWMARFRSVSGGGGSAHEPLAGVGAHVAGEAAWEGWDGELGLRFVDYALSSVDVRLPDGTSHTVAGGTLTGIGIDAGRAFAVTPDGDDGASVRPSLGIEWENHAAIDVSDAAGAKTHLFPSTSRLYPELRVAGRMPFEASEKHGAAWIGIGIVPFTSVSEAPSGSSGASPSAAVGFSWRLGGSLQLRPGLDLTAGYEGRMASTKFKGPAAGPYVPAVSNATVQEMDHVVGVGARTRF